MKPERYLIFNLSDGSTWGLPLKLVADARAKEICEEDASTTYEEEFHYVMRDSFEGIDWFKNNMNPDDLPLHEYVRIANPKQQSFLDRIADCEHVEIKDLPKKTAEDQFQRLSQTHDAVGVE